MNAAIYGILHNPVLIGAILSWALAQLIKFALAAVTDGQFNLARLFASGGMPSGHAALVSAVTFGVGREHGFYTSEFALAVVVALIVMYDAAGVRQSVGTQARIMNDILHDLYQGSGLRPVKIREILGHTPKEVIAGALLGLAVSFWI